LGENLILNLKSGGIIEGISWKAIFAGIITFLGLWFGFPEYLLNVRPQLEKTITPYSLCFIEGAISGAIVVILVLKLLSKFKKTEKNRKNKS